MANLPSVFAYQNDVENASDAPVTEALMVKNGSNDNYLYDQVTTQLTQITSLNAIRNRRLDVNFNSGVLSSTTSEITIASISSVVVPSGGTNIIGIGSRTTSSEFQIDSSLSMIVNNGSAQVTCRLKRGTTTLVSETLTATSAGLSPGIEAFISGGFHTFLDEPAAGTYTYSLTYQVISIGVTANVQVAAGLSLHVFQSPS